MSNNNFDKAFDLVVGVEGGYVNDQRDPGGRTAALSVSLTETPIVVAASMGSAVGVMKAIIRGPR